MKTLSLSDRIDIVLLNEGIVCEDDANKDSTRFINKNSVGRDEIMLSMKSAGHTVTSLAKACDCEPSMISRLLREPDDNTAAAEQKARNPSVTLAAKIASVLSSNAESLFPDIFNAPK